MEKGHCGELEGVEGGQTVFGMYCVRKESILKKKTLPYSIRK